MLKVKITGKMMASAKERAEKMGELANSITKGAGNLAGFLGEEIAAKVLHGVIKDTYEYDLVLEDGKTVDVKTKRTGVKPKPYYDCSVSTVTKKQKCDYYAFVRVLNDYSFGYYLGIKKNEDYYREATKYEKGDVDPDNKHEFAAPTFNLAIKELEL